MARSEPFGCRISLVDEAAIPIVSMPLVDRFTEYDWLLAHCDDGVTWGHRDGATWHLGSALGLSPEPTAGNLQQLRLFGDQRELLAWKSGSAFRARVLADDERHDLRSWMQPMEEWRLLVGDRLFERNGRFSVVGDGYGSRHGVPLPCEETDFDSGRRHPLRMLIRHYFERDESTGAVRIAATRLVTIENAARKEKRP